MTPSDARARLAEYGPNRIPAEDGHGLMRLLAGQFGDVLVRVLVAAALISGLSLDTAVGARLFTTVVLDAAFMAVTVTVAVTVTLGLAVLLGETIIRRR